MPPPGLAPFAQPPPNVTNASIAVPTSATASVVNTTGGGANTACSTTAGSNPIPSVSVGQQPPVNNNGGGAAGGCSNANNARKKTSFQITSVKVHDGGVHERDDTDGNAEPPLATTTINEQSPLQTTIANQTNAVHGAQNGGDVGPHDNKGGIAKKHSITDPQAVADQWSRRFRVVKIPFLEPFKRGRWTCTDFFDPPEQKQEEKQAQNQTNTSPGDGEGPNPDTIVDSQNKDGTGATPDESQASHLVGSINHSTTQTPAPTPQGQDGADGNYAACGAGGIDNKIEQAMDLVKSHLMFAVREEVDVLREKITELNERNEQLLQENQILRSLLTPEQTQRFTALQQQQQIQQKSATRPAAVPTNILPVTQGTLPRTAPSLAVFVGVSSTSLTTHVATQGPLTVKPVALPLTTATLTSTIATTTVQPPSVSSPSGPAPVSLPSTVLNNSSTPTKEQSPSAGPTIQTVAVPPKQ